MTNIFNENEKIAIAILTLKQIAVDRKIDGKELSARFENNFKYDLPVSVPADCEITFDKAKEIISAMEPEKKAIVLSMLQEIAEADSVFCEQEKEFINALVK